MATHSTFTGFSKETILFYRGLAENNSREWFEAHKVEYKEQVIAPAQRFVEALGQRLRSVAPNLVADTRINGAGSIFRIYRDTRFGPDKTPYKSFLGIFFWEGSRKKMENSGFYFQLDPENLLLGVGLHLFPQWFLKPYRNAVVDPDLGMHLLEAVEDVTATGVYQIGGKHFKRVPRGYDARHKNAEFLKYKGLSASFETSIPDECFSEALLDYCVEKFQDMAPVHRWLYSVLEQ